MLSNLIIRIFGGFGVGALLTLILLIILGNTTEEFSVRLIWLNLLGSMITGAYFSVSALLFAIERWSMLKQTVIHYTLSLIILFPVFTLLTGWVPLTPHSLLLGLVIFTATYVLNWAGWHMYYKQIEKRMNRSIQTRK